MTGEAGSKGRMLFVDDRTKRFRAAVEQFGADYDVTVACNVREALRLLSSEHFDVVSLDHDLDGCDFEDPDSPASGMGIVRYLEKTGGWPRWNDMNGCAFQEPSFWVHSKNLFAAHLMVTRLRALGLDARYRPFRYVETHMAYDSQGLPLR